MGPGEGGKGVPTGFLKAGIRWEAAFLSGRGRWIRGFPAAYKISQDNRRRFSKKDTPQGRCLRPFPGKFLIKKKKTEIIVSGMFLAFSFRYAGNMKNPLGGNFYPTNP